MRFWALLLITSLALADEECEQQQMAPDLEDAVKVARRLEFLAGTKDQIKLAACTRKRPFSKNEMRDWFFQNQSRYRLNEEIHGIKFEGESPEDLRTFRELTTAITEWKPDPKRQKTFDSTCKKVDCALKEIFGQEEGPRLHFLHRRFGLNASHLVESGSLAWKKEELDLSMMALSDFPEGIFPVSNNRKFIRRGNGPFGVYANAVITIYDAWTQLAPEVARATIFHELGHVIAGATHIDEEEAWKEKSGWISEKKVINGTTMEFHSSKKQDNFVSTYATKNPWEDFAETVTAYRYNPDELKVIDPAKYELVKKTVFDGVEYTSTEACQKPSRISHELKNKANEMIKTWKPTEAEFMEIASRCGPLAMETLFKDNQIKTLTEKFRACYEDSIRQSARTLLTKQLEGDPLAPYLIPMVQNTKLNIPHKKFMELMNKTQSLHHKELRAVLTKVFSDKFLCMEGHSKYAAVRFDGDRLKINTYKLRDELSKFVDKNCPTLKKVSMPKMVIQLVP